MEQTPANHTKHSALVKQLKLFAVVGCPILALVSAVLVQCGVAFPPRLSTAQIPVEAPVPVLLVPVEVPDAPTRVPKRDAIVAAEDLRTLLTSFALLGDQAGHRKLKSNHLVWVASGHQSLADLIERMRLTAIWAELLDKNGTLVARIMVRITYFEKGRPIQELDFSRLQRTLRDARAQIGVAADLRVLLESAELPYYCTLGELSPVPSHFTDVEVGEMFCSGRISANCDVSVSILVVQP